MDAGTVTKALACRRRLQENYYSPENNHVVRSVQGLESRQVTIPGGSGESRRLDKELSLDRQRPISKWTVRGHRVHLYSIN